MLCHKCKTNPPFEDDSWCLSCSAWESIGSDLTSRWDIPGLRELACEAVVSCARHLKGLRRVSAGLAAQQSAGASSAGSRPKRNAAEELVKPEEKKLDTRVREPLPRSRSSPAAAPEVKKEQLPSSGSDRSEDVEDDEEEGESEELQGTRRLPYAPGSQQGASRPSEPAGPPPSHRREDNSEAKRSDRGHRDRGHRGEGEKSRKRRKRAGRKHKGLSRLVENPHARVHRSLDPSYWNRSPRGESGFSRHK